METTYCIDDILYALTYKETFEANAISSGNFDWLDIIYDAEKILEEAALTDRQQKIFDMYYIKDYTLVQIGDMLGVSHQCIADSLRQSKKKIQRVLDNMKEED